MLPAMSAWPRASATSMSALGHGAVESVDERSTTSLWSNDALLVLPAVRAGSVLQLRGRGRLRRLPAPAEPGMATSSAACKKIELAMVCGPVRAVGDWIYAYGNSGKLVGLTIR